MDIELAEAYGQMLADMPAIFSLTLVAVMGLVIIVLDAFRNNDPSIPWITGITLGVAMAWEAAHLGTQPGTAFMDMVRTGGFAAFVNLLILGAGLLTVVLSVPYLRSIKKDFGEVYALLLFAIVGMILLATANNLIAVFVGLETMSIPLYIMAGLVREDEGSIEAALKYFLLGAFATGFFLYGIALLYGATGTMYLPEMGAGLAETGSEIMFWAGVALLLIGFMFKVSAVPFHMWTPDVYQGAPTTLTGFMSTASKVSAFAALVLILYHALPVERWTHVLAFLAVVTMVIGNVLALAQPNVKRMLAYSSIAHAGYVLVGLTAGSAAGYGGVLFYLLVYTLMNVGAFGVMALLEWDGKIGREQTLDSLAGIGTRKPLLGTTMGIFMFSLIGFPPLGGFWGKYAVFAPAVDAGFTWLVILAVLMSAVSAYYYLRVVYVFWMLDESDATDTQATSQAVFPVPVASAAVLVVCAGLLIVLGILPGGVLEAASTMFSDGAGTAWSTP